MGHDHLWYVAHFVDRGEDCRNDLGSSTQMSRIADLPYPNSCLFIALSSEVSVDIMSRNNVQRSIRRYAVSIPYWDKGGDYFLG